MVEELDNTFTRLINCTHVDEMKENDKNKRNSVWSVSIFVNIAHLTTGELAAIRFFDFH